MDARVKAFRKVIINIIICRQNECIGLCPFCFGLFLGYFRIYGNKERGRGERASEGEKGREQGRKKVKGGSRAKSPGCDKKFILDKGQIIIRDV